MHKETLYVTKLNRTHYANAIKPTIQRVAANTQGRDFAVGDLHGAYDKLMAALENIGFNPATDRLFCTGDLVDRGPGSYECLKLTEEPWFFSVEGNHEQMASDGLQALIDYDNNKSTNSDMYVHWMRNGGKWIFEYTDKQEEILYRLKRLPTVILIADRVAIVHAQVFENTLSEALEGVDKEDLLWGRSRYYSAPPELVSDVECVICGHTPVEFFELKGNHLYIDTGVVFSKQKEFTLLEITNKSLKELTEVINEQEEQYAAERIRRVVMEGSM